MLDLENTLQEKLKALETLKGKIKECEDAKQRLLTEALELQGAVKQLAELVNSEKEKSDMAKEVVAEKA